MDDVCTCGARVLSDARFCHKCGRPLRDDVAAEEAAQAAAASVLPLPPATQPVPIGFRNSTAVRVALLTALLTCVACVAAVPILVAAAWLLTFVLIAGGVASVYLYNRRTGHPVTIVGGARIGWLTGVFCFVILILMLTLVFAMVASMGVEQVARELANTTGGQAQADQFREIMASPAAIIFGVLAWFVLLTSLPTIGGALGAKVFERL
ncbi:MAG TPA: hypothetical protein VFL57_00260 [Bryobacteraceae bacterium]|nr:hypothetical protein [Bryobacteraceae bacterium]